MKNQPPFHLLKRVTRSLSLAVLVGMAALSLGGCNKDASTTNDPMIQSAEQAASDLPSPIPTSPGEMVIPADNPMTPAKVALGKMFFFDSNFSVPTQSKNGQMTSTVACASCHAESRGFSDMTAFSKGIKDQMGTRNAPSLTNVAYNGAFTWSGTFSTLEKHAPAPMFSSVEMGNNFSKSADDTTAHGYHSDPGQNDTMFLFRRVLQNSARSTEYTVAWHNAFGNAEVHLFDIVNCIACFERTLTSTTSAFDLYNRGNKNAISASAKRGFQLFINPQKANCISCHSGFDFNGTGKDAAGNDLDPKLIFRNNGLAPATPPGGKGYDVGRMENSKDPNDMYKFKVPTLRNVALTGPYMHDGRFATLEQVLAHYNKGGENTQGQDKNVHKLNLSNDDIQDIIAFLKSLTDTKTITAMMSTDNRSPFNK